MNLKDSIKVNLTEQVFNKIRTLCSIINEVEWSGAIFYDIEGSFQKPQDIKIIVHDLIPLDKGNSAYTEYSFDERLMEYAMKKGYLERAMKIGHIHSHHNMKTFFSGTDNDEVNENSEFQNPYLSIIVNNRGDYSAKIAFRGQAKESSVSYDFVDIDGKQSQFVNNSKKEVVFCYECDVINPEYDEDFANQINNICTPKSLSKEINIYNQSFDFDEGLDEEDENKNLYSYLLLCGSCSLEEIPSLEVTLASLQQRLFLKKNSKEWIDKFFHTFEDNLKKFFSTISFENIDFTAEYYLNALIDELYFYPEAELIMNTIEKYITDATK